jgi:hypothetical protein
MKLTLKWWPKRGRNHTGSRTKPESELTDKQWFLVADLFENPEPSPAGGRPRVDPRRHSEWTELGLLEEAWRRLLLRLDHRGRLKLDEAFADGTLASAQRGVKRSA